MLETYQYITAQGQQGQDSPITEDSTDLYLSDTLHESEAHGGTVICFIVGNLEKHGNLCLPPPKLYYSTFWRSLTRRIYRKDSDESRQKARDEGCMRQRRTPDQTFEAQSNSKLA